MKTTIQLLALMAIAAAFGGAAQASGFLVGLVAVAMAAAFLKWLLFG